MIFLGNNINEINLIKLNFPFIQIQSRQNLIIGKNYDLEDILDISNRSREGDVVHQMNIEYHSSTRTYSTDLDKIKLNKKAILKSKLAFHDGDSIIIYEAVTNGKFVMIDNTIEYLVDGTKYLGNQLFNKNKNLTLTELNKVNNFDFNPLYKSMNNLLDDKYVNIYSPDDIKNYLLKGN